MEHVIVTRFSVPHSLGAVASLHGDPAWLEGRFDLFRRFYVPSVERLGVQAVLLCSSQTCDRVAEAVSGLGWVRVVRQDDWSGGWRGRPDQILTRHDSDDAIHGGWFEAVDAAAPQAQVVCSHRFLRLDLRRKVVFHYRRRRPCPLAAFRGGINPFAHDHEELPQHYSTVSVRGAYLLQIAHGGNLKTRFPKPFRRRAPAEIVRRFGLDPSMLA